MVKLTKFAKYAQILKNSVATKEIATERLFLMKDLAAVEEAVGLLKRENGKYALATQCIGGGQGIATILEAA